MEKISNYNNAINQEQLMKSFRVVDLKQFLKFLELDSDFYT